MATLKGTKGNDSLVTRSIFTDTLYGDEGDDTLDGGWGSNKLYGGAGNDTYILNSASDVVFELPNEGIDTARAGFNIDLRKAAYANLENVLLTGTARRADGSALSNKLVGNTQANTLYGYAGQDTLEGLDGNDTLDGGDDHDTLLGGAGLDVLLGGAGNDLLDGGAGNDKMTGGAGDDRYLLDNAGDVVTEAAGGGNDTVVLGYDAGLVDLATYVNIENLSLSTLGGGSILGTASANVLTGNDGFNNFSGLGGNDTLIGLGGNDSYNDVDEGDVLIEAEGGGTDAIVWAGRTSVDLANFAHIEDVTLQDGGVGLALNITGNAGDNRLTGNSLTNVLRGLGGNDTLDGRGALTNGNSGAVDTLEGGAGNDVYQLDLGSFQAPVVIEQADEGIDTVSFATYIAGGYRLSDNVENLFGVAYQQSNGNGSLSLIGNALNNTLSATSVYAFIDGGEGADQMSVSNPYYASGLVATFVVDNEGDTIAFGGSRYSTYAAVRASIDYDLSQHAGVRALTLTGQANLNGAGGQGADTLTGNDGANTLSAGDGNDRLDGGLGNDSLDGGQGDDTYLVGNLAGSDRITDQGGNDVLQFTGDITYDRLFFSQDGADLSIQVINSVDGGFNAANGARVAGWFSADGQQIETIQAGGRQLDRSQVQALVDTMAANVLSGPAPSTGPGFLTGTLTSAIAQQAAQFWSAPA